MSEKKRIHYVKLHVPWQVMCRRAEELNLHVPLQVPILFSYIKTERRTSTSSFAVDS